MKICVVSSTVFQLGESGLLGYGGLEQVAWQTAKGLAEKGHTVSLVAPEGSVCPNVTIIPTGKAGTWDEARAYNTYWQQLPEFDVILDHSWQKWAYCLKAEDRLKAPVLGVMHAPVNTMYQVWPPTFPNLPPVEKACPVCISQDQANHFEALFSTPAKVCHNGIDLDFYYPLGIPRSNRFLFLARFSTIKGPHLAIEACQKAGVGLDLVGDTSITQEPEYLAQCKSMCDGKQIRMVGPASRSECVYWFSQAHCLLHPNKSFREPFGLAPVEAMACDCPVIAWDHGAMRETIKTGPASSSTGQLVKTLDEFASAVKYAAFPDPVWDGERLADTWRKNCREQASLFSVQRMVDRYESLCQEAVETGGW